MLELDRLNLLLSKRAKKTPKEFKHFWEASYEKALQVDNSTKMIKTGKSYKRWEVYNLTYTSTDNFKIGGWLLLPKSKKVDKVFIVGHGYGGRSNPDFNLEEYNTALIFPCFRGLSRSARKPISQNPYWHVLHNIQDRERYIIKGCVEDLWGAVSVAKDLYPNIRITLTGVSLGGGIGILALAQDKRITDAKFEVPTFGSHLDRIKVNTCGSGKSQQDFYKHSPYTIIRTLRYYDAAIAARFVTQPVEFTLALEDHVVAPEGQWAIYNECTCEKSLTVMAKGHI